MHWGAPGKKDYFNTPNPDLTHVYTYNDRDELVADVMNRGGTYSYSYDNIGNRLTSQEGAEAAPTVYLSNNLNQYISGDREPSQEETGEVTIVYETNSLNQYTSIIGGEESPLIREYDEDGNQIKVKTSTGEWEVKYNALNQAVRFTQDAKRVECRYDYLNRRVEKQSMKEKCWCPGNGLFTVVFSNLRNWMQPMQRKRCNPFFGKPIYGILWSPRQHESWQ